jgi:hypothetical protein
MSRRSARLANINHEQKDIKDHLRCGDTSDDTYEKSDTETKKSIDLRLKQNFIENGLFTPCEHAVFGLDRYDGILVATACGHTFCMTGTLLRDISDLDYIIGRLTEKGIHWID